MTLRKVQPPSFTLEDYHRLDMLATQSVLLEERARLLSLTVKTLRKLLVECGIEGSLAETIYWTKADMVQAIAEHVVLAMEEAAW